MHADHMRRLVPGGGPDMAAGYHDIPDLSRPGICRRFARMCRESDLRCGFRADSRTLFGTESRSVDANGSRRERVVQPAADGVRLMAAAIERFEFVSENGARMVRRQVAPECANPAAGSMRAMFGQSFTMPCANRFRARRLGYFGRT